MARSWTTDAPSPDDAAAQYAIQERLRMARALREQSMQGASLENVGGQLVGNPIARALTSGLQGFSAGRQEKRALGDASALAGQQRERLAAALAGAGEAKTPDDLMAYGQKLLADPATAEVGQFYVQAGQKAKEREATRQDKKYEETNKDLRLMKKLRAEQDLAEYKAKHGQLAGMGTLYPTGNGYLQRMPDGSWGYVQVGDERPVPGAYDPRVKYNLTGAGAVGDAAGDQVAAGNPAIPPAPFVGGPSAPPPQGAAPPMAPPQGAAPPMAPPQGAAPPMAPPQGAAPPMAPPQGAAPPMAPPLGLGYKAQQDVAKAGPTQDAKKTAEAAAIARIALAKAEIDLPSTLASGESLLNHPGLSDAVGWKGAPYLYGAMSKPIPGTAAAGFQSKYDSFMAKQFLAGYEVLKGGGQITEIEGQQARDAQVAMSQAQNEEEFKAALRDGIDAIKRGVEKLRVVAAMGGAQVPPPPRTPEEYRQRQGAQGSAPPPDPLGLRK